MKISQLVVAISVTTASALVLAGCSTAGVPATPEGGSPIVFGQIEGVTQLDPNITAVETDVVPTLLLFSALTELTPEATADPDVAESWEVSEDGLEWTFSLREGVEFHDGTPLTAEHVVGSIEYVLNPETASQNAAKIGAIQTVTAPDESTVTIELSAPSPQLDASLSYIKIVNVEELDSINSAPNGTGPYKFESFTPGQELVVAANESYYGGTPEAPSIRIVKYADQTAAERALVSGELTAYYGVPKNNLESLLANDSLQLIDSDSPGGLAAWGVDTTSAPFDNVLARQALSYATDRETMIAVGYSGQATVNEANTIVSPESPFFNSDTTTYPFDLEKAQELFAEAGIGEGDTITFWTLAGAFPEWVTMAEVLQSDLASIGITLSIESNETNTWLEAFYPNGKSYPGLIVGNQLSFPSVPDTFSALWFSDQGSCECNWVGTPAYNEAVAVATTSSDEAEREAAFDVIQAEISENVPMLIIGNVGASVVAQDGLDGVWMQGDNVVHLQHAVLN